MTAPQIKITTLTLNPAIDETITLAELRPGEVLRAQTAHYHAGGKGVNVASCLAAGTLYPLVLGSGKGANVASSLAQGGYTVTATGLLGRENAPFFRDFFSRQGIEDDFLYIEGATRTNIKLVTPDSTTDINLPGLPATHAALTAIREKLAAASPDFLVLAGSLPPGCPDDFYAELISAQRPDKTRVIADCSGKPLRALLAAGARPFCIKPNRDELAEWAGRPLMTMEDILTEAKKLYSTGITLVVVSMGRDGALFVSDKGAIHVELKLDNVGSTVGAGDAMVAGIVSALSKGAALEFIAIHATAWAAGKLECQGAALPSAARLEELAQQSWFQMVRSTSKPKS